MAMQSCLQANKTTQAYCLVTLVDRESCVFINRMPECIESDQMCVKGIIRSPVIEQQSTRSSLVVSSC